MIRTAASRRFSVFAVTAIAVLGVPAWTGGAHAQTSYAVLHTFAGPPNDGYTPSVGLGPIQAADGTLYGTTFLGGSLDRGTIFQVAPDGTGFTLLHSFTAGPMDGANPEGGLLQGPDGTLYGTTSYGGAADLGTVFQLRPDGSFALLHSFTGAEAGDGASPTAGLFQASDGMLYGTTYVGGSLDRGSFFQMAPDGTGFTLLHSFTGGAMDGAYPQAALLQGPDGTLYGTTTQGGTANFGTIFEMAPDGTGFTLLHSFTRATMDGAQPLAGLIQDPDGTLYGTTQYGGPVDLGTVFQIAPDGTGFALLHAFTGLDGANPTNVIQGPDGTLYGTTFLGGTRGRGTVYQLAAVTGYALLHAFGDGPSDAQLPTAGLVQGPDGTLYGTTSGEIGQGVVFWVSPGAVVCGH